MQSTDENNDTRIQPTVEEKSHYCVVRETIEWLHSNYHEQPTMDQIADAIGIDAPRLTKIFKRWAGLTPTAFLQAVTLDHARKLLNDSASILDTSFDLGLSSPSRLHDLFVTHEAMPPGQFKSKGAGLDIRYGYHPSPFGVSLLMLTDYGLAGLAFCEEQEASKLACLQDMTKRWPNAKYSQADSNEIAFFANRIFDPNQWREDQPLKIFLIGTDFQVRVWETLLKIPPGRASTYGDVATKIEKPTASRAVGAAVGRNPISFVVPCHRVVGANASLTGYHWGLTRKRAMLGWETGLVQR